MSRYGFCPICGERGISRERRMGGNDTCENGHVYPSKERFNTYQQFVNNKDQKMDKVQIQNKINELQSLLNDDTTEYNIILDRSGSMHRIKDDMEGGFKTWLETEKKLSGQATINLYQFDHQFEIVYENKQLNEATLTLLPRGSTSLNDAIGQTIGIVKERQKTNRPSKTVFVIITDGIENSSHEWTSSSVKKLVEKESKQQDWVFLYIGANQDAVLTGRDRGINLGKSLNYEATKDGTKYMWASISKGTEKIRCANNESYRSMVVDREAVFDSSESNPRYEK